MMRNGLCALALSVALFPICVPASAQGADSCQPVFDALIKAATTPNHSYTTSTGINGGKTTEAETIVANGQKYIRTRGKWMRIPVSSQDMVEEEKEREHQGKSTCQFLRTESVNGEAAMLYSFHRNYEDIKEDGQMWVSRSSGMIVRAEFDVDSPENKVKEHRSSRIEYGNIQPPI
ncbi:MAG TPA: hypothetical protein VH437_10110 [Terriglobales bacterium]|jgi:hypothetical protein